MGRFEKLLLKVLRGTADANIDFDDLRQLLLHLGFEERINLQQDGSKAKPYQVRQVRAVITRYKLGGEE
ncbi:MAG: hypothetical protein N2313_10665 [Meiothermus ruber]|nr:hypothetical protein [Meiothermus ruber]